MTGYSEGAMASDVSYVVCWLLYNGSALINITVATFCSFNWLALSLILGFGSSLQEGENAAMFLFWWWWHAQCWLRCN